MRPFEAGGIPLNGPPPTGHALTAERPGEPFRQTALANAVTEAERAQRNVPQIEKQARQANPEVWDRMLNILARDPQASIHLVDELEARPRATTVEENALLLHRRIDLSNRHHAAAREALTASLHTLNSPELDALQAKEAGFLAEIDRVDKVIVATGTEWGRAGQFRRQLAREDFSLATMLGRATLAKGKELTTEEKAVVTKHQEAIEKADTDLAAAEAKATPSGGGLKIIRKGPDLADLRIETRRARRAFANTLVDLRTAGLPLHRRILGGIGEAFSASRSLITAFDLSAVFRQGGVFAFSRPIQAAKAIPEMLRSFASEHGAERAADAIQQRPNALLYEKSGLYLADQAGPLSVQEEAFIGRWVNKIPGVAASARAYTTFLNRIRADVFDTLTATLSRKAAPSLVEAKAVANFVNVATGRGPLGSMERAAVPLAHLLFSPRFLVSRFQLLAGQPLYGGTMRTRGIIASEYARALAGVGLFYALAALDDKAKISFDPRSTDFGKIRYGNTRVDPLAGLAQVAVFVTRVVSGETKNAAGKVVPLRDQLRYSATGKVPFGGDSVGDVIGRFVRGKMAPVPGAGINMLAGKNVVGEPVTAATTLRDLTVPMAVRDVFEAMLDQGVPRGTAVSLLAVLGMGAQTYEPRAVEAGKPPSALHRAAESGLVQMGAPPGLRRVLIGK